MITSKLSEILGKKRIKMSELAKKAGINKNTVLNLYHDRITRIDFEVLNKLCNVLECAPSDILHHTPDLDAPHLAAGKFGAPVPTTAEAIQVGDDEYIDADGNKFSRASILINEHFGGGFERVSSSLFDDPLGLNDAADDNSHCEECGNFHEDCECEK